MRRRSVGKQIQLTERDIELFKLLNRYQYLRSNFLHAFLGGASETRFKERLGDLYHDGRFINRPEQQWQFANSRCMPLVYELDTNGEQVLRDHGLLVHDAALVRNGRMGVCRQFAHQLMICDILASIELGIRQTTNLRFLSWRDILAKAPESTRGLENPFAMPVTISHAFARGIQTAEISAVPDAVFGLEYSLATQKLYRFFAVEADRNTAPVRRENLRQTSYLRKILAYRKIVADGIHKQHFGVPNLFVLTVTTNERHMRHIMELVGELATDGKSTLFLFKTMSSLGDFQAAPSPTPHMLCMPWLRVGYEPLVIDRA